MSGSLGGGFIPSNRPSKACKATNNRQTMQGNKLSANARLHYIECTITIQIYFL